MISILPRYATVPTEFELIRNQYLYTSVLLTHTGEGQNNGNTFDSRHFAQFFLRLQENEKRICFSSTFFSEKLVAMAIL